MPVEPHFGRFQKCDLVLLKVGRLFRNSHGGICIPAGNVCRVVCEQLTRKIKSIKVDYELECLYQDQWVRGTVAERDLFPALKGSKVHNLFGRYTVSGAVYASNRYYPNDLIEELYQCEEPERAPRRLVETAGGRKVWL